MRLADLAGHHLRLRVDVRGGAQAHAQLVDAAQALAPEVGLGGEAAQLLGQVELLGALLQLLACPVDDALVLLAVAVEDQLLVLGANVLLGTGNGRQSRLLLLLVQLALHPVGQVQGTRPRSARLIQDAALLVNQQLDLLDMAMAKAGAALLQEALCLA